MKPKIPIQAENNKISEPERTINRKMSLSKQLCKSKKMSSIKHSVKKKTMKIIARGKFHAKTDHQLERPTRQKKTPMDNPKSNSYNNKPQTNMKALKAKKSKRS
jgi:hypothetical protein